MTGSRRVLILGGTAEATTLAGRLVAAGGWAVTTSLAGRTGRPAPVPGALRIGGFGGVEGLTRHLIDEDVALLIDATHPFAAQMAANAAAAATRAGVPRIKLLRPAWHPRPGDDWIDVADTLSAARVLAGLPRGPAFLTIGRKDLAPFAATGRPLVIRSIEDPGPVPTGTIVLAARGPFDIGAETALMHAHGIAVLVTKNAGGEATAAKLAAARALSLPVVMIARPPAPDGPVVTGVDAAIDLAYTLVNNPS